ncbi:MAG: DUF6526 family protein [Acidobacteria bacterium]|nr:DUF6526 family protein [Acidobacteriota bacterium]MCL5287691.1 DUF6526 family protein [Acidobacteriota bacterium]
MAEPTTQNYANHVRKLPPLFLAASLVLAVNVLWSIYGAVRGLSFGSVLNVFLAASLIVMFLFSRMFALSVQDRVIRLEERMRMERLLPADLRPRIGEFTVKQLIGLRFASDAELPALAREVLDGKLTELHAIKRAVKDWRADWQRA